MATRTGRSRAGEDRPRPAGEWGSSSSLLLEQPVDPGGERRPLLMEGAQRRPACRRDAVVTPRRSCLRLDPRRLDEPFAPQPGEQGIERALAGEQSQLTELGAELGGVLRLASNEREDAELDRATAEVRHVRLRFHASHGTLRTRPPPGWSGGVRLRRRGPIATWRPPLSHLRSAPR